MLCVLRQSKFCPCSNSSIHEWLPRTRAAKLTLLMSLNLPRVRTALQTFDYPSLFIEELGWNRPSSKRAVPLKGGYALEEIAQLGGAKVYRVGSPDGEMPDKDTRKLLSKEAATVALEHVLIFERRERNETQALLLYWAKRDGKKILPREHEFFRGQSGDLFLSKLSSMYVDLKELDERGDLGILEATRKLEGALDLEKVTKRFYGDFQKEHGKFREFILGINDERDRSWYASVLLNRLMFIYFLQKKGFLDGGRTDYLWEKYEETVSSGKGYFEDFLKPLFFEGFALSEEQRSPEAKKLLGKIKYLNGGLFLPHPIETKYESTLTVEDAAFAELLRSDGVKGLFERYSWHLDDTPSGKLWWKCTLGNRLR